MSQRVNGYTIAPHVNLQDANLQDANLQDADLWDADLRGADLWDADLRGANLRDANLQDANLRDANLSNADLWGADLQGARLWTGESFKQYLSDVVPALCRAGGKTLEAVAAAWACHSWENCPMAVAFSVSKIEDMPLLHQPRVTQFIQLFDAGLIPRPMTTGETT